MSELTPEAKNRLNDYLQRTRAALAGSRTVEATEVEQNVREHLDVALESAPGPVSAGRRGLVVGASFARVRPSVVSRLKSGVELLEVDACVVGRELPVHTSA